MSSGAVGVKSCRDRRRRRGGTDDMSKESEGECAAAGVPARARAAVAVAARSDIVRRIEMRFGLGEAAAGFRAPSILGCGRSSEAKQ